ncbi:MAG: hypothetical protein GY820_30685 [Gammaproteobacteria bacterium]|nr:hypothetical protein [Gammaproteobacteria bacterium]
MVLSLYLGLLSLGIVLKSLLLLGTLLKFIGRSLCCVAKTSFLFIKWTRRRTPVDKPTIVSPRPTQMSSTRPSSHRANLPYFMAILALVTLSVNGCSQVTTLTAKESSCSVLRSGATECSIHNVNRLVLAPQGQETCLLMKRGKDEPLGTLKVVVHKATLSCQPRTEYYTRSFEMKHRSVKRCPTAGSCNSANKCGDVGLTTKIEEMNGEPNNKPGFSYCAESPGGPFFGCFWSAYACLYYRTYAMPVSTTTYEVFSCPTWRYKIAATIQLESNGTTESHEMRLVPGIPTEWKKVKLTLISVTTPQVPQLTNYFLTDNNRTASVAASARGVPVVGTIGVMQCHSLSKAAAFDCDIPPQTCDCLPGDSSVACTCVHGQLESVFNSDEKLLPLATTDYTLMGKAKEVELEYQQQAGLELQLQMRGLKLLTQVDRSSCTITPGNFQGCYNCLTGAEIKFECQTDFGDATAHVNCGRATFTTTCSPESVESTAQLHFTHPNVNERCEVSCPAGPTYFQLNGTLVFVESKLLFNASTQVQVTTINETSFSMALDVFAGINNWFKSSWQRLLTFVGIFLVALLLIPLVPVLLQTLFWLSNRAGSYAVSKLYKLSQGKAQMKKKM